MVTKPGACDPNSADTKVADFSATIAVDGAQFPQNAASVSNCSCEANARSIAGDQNINVHFINDTGNALTAWWLDYSGKRVSYGPVYAGEGTGLLTYATHPWVFTGDQNKCLYVLTVH